VAVSASAPRWRATLRTRFRAGNRAVRPRRPGWYPAFHPPPDESPPRFRGGGVVDDGDDDDDAAAVNAAVVRISAGGVMK